MIKASYTQEQEGATPLKQILYLTPSNQSARKGTSFLIFLSSAVKNDGGKSTPQ